MRIGGPARKHGVAEGDIWHAVRNAMRHVIIDDDLTMIVGPAADGALLEIGVPTSTVTTRLSCTPCRSDRSSVASSSDGERR